MLRMTSVHVRRLRHSLRRGKPVLSEAEGIEMGVLKQNLRSPLPCLPRQGEGVKAVVAQLFHLSLPNYFRERNYKSFKRESLAIRPRSFSKNGFRISPINDDLISV